MSGAGDTERRVKPYSVRSDVFQELVEESNDISYVVDPRGILTYISPQVSRYGFRAEEMVSKNFLDFVLPEDRERVGRDFQDAMATGEERRTELRALCPDGRIVWLEDHGSVRCGDGGATVGMTGILRDITGRKQTQAALQRRDAILAAVASAADALLKSASWRECVPHILSDLGRATQVSRVVLFENQVNDAGETLTSQQAEWAAEGVEPQIGNKALQSLPLCAAGFARWEAAMRSGQPIHGHVSAFPESEQRILLEQGIKSLAVMPVFIDGEWWGFIGFDECAAERDLSGADLDALKAAAGALGAAIRRQRAEEALRRAHDSLEERVRERVDELRRVNESLRHEMGERQRAESERHALEPRVQHAQKLESLGMLAGVIAHDFNNILMAILGNADLALELSPFSAVRDLLQEIVGASHRAADLCKQMLAYSGRAKLVAEEVDLSALVREMSRMLAISVSKKATLEFHLAPNLPAVFGDATQLRQVLMNLVINASDALGDQGGAISVATSVRACDAAWLGEAYLGEGLAGGRYVVLEVTDTGCGMDSATLGRLFEPFFTTKPTGRGLGLSAALGILRTHKGAIRVTTEQGKGSAFTAALPAAAAPAPKALEEEHADLTSWRGKGTVLIVDDERTIRAVGARMLTLLGFDVRTAADGQEAIQLLQRSGDQIACVVLDMTMPRLDGPETLKELRKIRPDLPAILCSGYDEEEVTPRLRGIGAVSFIQKPYTIEALAIRLREALGGAS